MNTKLLYIDIEITKNGRIKDVGALFGEQKLHTGSVAQLKPWIQEATYICGHNIVAHDIPLLKKVLGEEIFQQKIMVDTLVWSPILFNENPYHKLVKGYKIVNDSDYNNPLSDCILTQQLMGEELDKFNTLPLALKQLYTYLLSNSAAHKGFIEYINFQTSPELSRSSLGQLLQDKVCANSNIQQIAKENPIELAYVIALMHANENSILPNWVRQSYPKTQHILDSIRFGYCGTTQCQYCNSHLNPKKALQTYFGYSNFRKFDADVSTGLQEHTVRAGLTSESFVAVFPTGGGKSLTFQLLH